jgi:hypothetical protein
MGGTGSSYQRTSTSRVARGSHQGIDGPVRAEARILGQEDDNRLYCLPLLGPPAIPICSVILVRYF